MISAMLPFPWMFNNSSSVHVEVDIQGAPGQIFICFNSSGMITLFPECSFAVAAFVIDCSNPRGHKLHEFWDSFLILRPNQQKMNMIRGYRKIEYAYKKTLPTLP